MAFNQRLALCGWVEDKPGIQAYARENGTLSRVASALIGGEQRDANLWQALLKVHPTWRRGSQGIGDCVSFGAELCATTLMGVESVFGTMTWHGEAATEPIYGGARVEVLKKSRGGRQDGAFGYAAAKWLKEYGVVLRRDYSAQTGNPEHNLKAYSPAKAKEWGDFGCGGASDKGLLDNIARVHPIENVTQVSKVAEAIAALQNWYPISIASMAGFGQMHRDANGLCYRSGEWAHQMCVLAIRWRNGKPEFRIFQSWGDSCSGDDPGTEALIAGIPNLIVPKPASLITPEGAIKYSGTVAWNPISACSWWVDEATMAWILSTGDCWTYSGVKGFEPRKLDVKKAVLDYLS